MSEWIKEELVAQADELRGMLWCGVPINDMSKQELLGVIVAMKRLGEMGVGILHDGIVAHGEGAPSGGIYFEDPDGTRLEIYAPDAGEGHSAPAGAAPT